MLNDEGRTPDEYGIPLGCLPDRGQVVVRRHGDRTLVNVRQAGSARLGSECTMRSLGTEHDALREGLAMVMSGGGTLGLDDANGAANRSLSGPLAVAHRAMLQRMLSGRTSDGELVRFRQAADLTDLPLHALCSPPAHPPSGGTWVTLWSAETAR